MLRRDIARDVELGAADVDPEPHRIAPGGARIRRDPRAERMRVDLTRDAPRVAGRRAPEYEQEYARRGWTMFPGIDRVYVNHRAITELGWRPKYDFGYVLECLRSDRDFRSPLAREVGSKGYHDRVFRDGPYPLE